MLHLCWQKSMPCPFLHHFFPRMVEILSVPSKQTPTTAKTETWHNSDPEMSNGGCREREEWGHPPLPELLSSRGDAAKERTAAQRSMDNHRNRHACSNLFLRIRGSLLTFALASKRTASSDHLPPVSRQDDQPSPAFRPHEFGVRAFLPASCTRQDSAIRVGSVTVRRSVGVKGVTPASCPPPPSSADHRVRLEPRRPNL